LENLLHFPAKGFSIPLKRAPPETRQRGNIIEIISNKARFWQMDEPSENSNEGVGASVNKVVNDFITGLSDEHRMLVILKAQLYGGTWNPMLDDLENRLEGKPYIFKLANRIKDDIQRIEQMRKFEEEHNIDLTEYVELS